MDLRMTEDEAESARMSEQFTEAAHRTDHLLHQLYDMEMESGAVLSGALTTVIHHLLELAPDNASAMGVLASCMRNASIQNTMKATLFEMDESELDDDNDPSPAVKVH